MLRPICIIICHLMFCCVAVAEDAAAPAASETPRPTATAKPIAEQPAGSASRPIQEVDLPLLYLKDKQGNLQAVPGFSFDDFLEYYKIKYQLEQPQQPPRYSLQRITVVGTVRGQQAELTIRFKIRADDQNWVRIPLRLEQAVLTEPVQHEGSGEQFTHFEENGEGYVSWIRSPAGEQHELTLKVLVGLTAAGEVSRLRLLLPRATTSELKLSVPLADVSAKVSEGATLLRPVADAQGHCELTVQGLGGDFELSWRAAGARAAEMPTVLEAEGKILARIDSRNIDTDATLTVRSYGDPFDRFRVRLPQGAELLPGTPSDSGAPSDYSVTPVDNPSKTFDKRLVEVRLAKRSTGPIVIQLGTRRSHEIGPSVEWLELSGFEVVEAARQWGYIAVAITGDWHVVWGPKRGLRQVDEWPESLHYKDVLAGFEYFAHPCSLTARLVARNTHITAEPEYRLSIDPDQARLEATLKYTIRGAKTFALGVRLGDWMFDEVKPEHVVDVRGVAVNPAQTLSFPLQQPSTGQIELVVRAHRPIPPGSKDLKFSLPQPEADSLGPASLVVLPADNVEITPNGQEMPGLSLQQVPPQMQLPPRQQEPLFYRGDAAKAVFAGSFRIHPRSVTVDVHTQASLDPPTAQVEQRLAYTVTYEPIDRLLIEVPRSLVSLEGFSVRWQGQSLMPVPTPESENLGPAATSVRMWVALPTAQIGAGELVLHYPLKMPPLRTDAATVLRLPQVMPVDGKLRSNRLTLSTGAGVLVEPQAKGPWSPAEDELPRSGRQRTLSLVSTQPTAEAALEVRLEDQGQAGSTVIERAWVQTRLSPTARQDRAIFRFSSSEKELELSMPEGAALAQMSSLLDGRPIEPGRTGERLTIPLPASTGPQQHLLELRYHFPDGRPPGGGMALDFPQVGHNTWTRRLYWQLILPRNEHVVVPPPQLTREFSWCWNELFWERRPLLEQSQLEAWIGAEHEAPIPEGTNRYLFSGLGPISGGELRTASQAWIVLLASGAALVVGLTLIYVPATRHPAALFALAVLLLALGGLYPEQTLLLAQAASLGLALTLVAMVLRRSVARPQPAHRDVSQILMEKGSTKVFHPSPVAANPASTQSVPVPLPSAPLDAKV
jgi:hypothetical protein